MVAIQQKAQAHVGPDAHTLTRFHRDCSRAQMYSLGTKCQVDRMPSRHRWQNEAGSRDEWFPLENHLRVL